MTDEVQAETRAPGEPDAPERETAPTAGRLGAAGEDVISTVLAVDLDGTLLRIDSLHESAFALAARDGPRGVVTVLSILLRRGLGRAAVKADLAARIIPDPARLPYRDSVLQRLRDARAEGRRTVLITAADQRVAQAVADHLGLFDEVHGSDGALNLSGEEKAALLTERYGPQGFDYIADATGDLPVWTAARRSATAGARRGARRALDRACAAEGLPPPEHMDPRPRGPGAVWPYFRALRPHQWVKNTLVFLPMLSWHSLAADHVQAVTTAALAFCMVASGAYVINDLLDLSADRAHPRKRFRPFAAGEVPALQGVVMGVALLAAGLATAYSVNALTFGITTLYFGSTLLYSLVLKRELVIDICTLAGLYALRMLAGGAAIGWYLSPWMLALSVFLFLSLAAMKRQTELVDAAATGRSGAAGRAYEPADLVVVTMMAIAAGYVSVLVLALYIYSPEVQALYRSPLILWGIPPILLYWVSRLVMLAHRGRMDDDPVLFALKDPISWASGAVILGVAVAAKWL
ncbi:MAG: UbiA family prenyltransferase [Pseudomonadota bacterium]